MNDAAPALAQPPYPYEGPAEFAVPIESALRQVVDPEVALSIVDMGLVYGVRVEGQQVQVRMTMTSAACPVGDVIGADVEAELGAVLPPGHEVEIEWVWEPAWTPERMSPRARSFMGW